MPIGAAISAAANPLFVNASTWALMLTGRVDPHGPAGGGSGRRAAPPGGAQRRAGDPPGGDPGHAHPGPPVRHGPHHRGGAGPRPRPGEARLSLFLRHAGRIRAHGRRCRALRPGLSRRHRRDRPRLGRPRPDRGARHLGQALGAPSALRIRPAPSRDGRAGAAAGGAGAASPRRPISASPSMPRRPIASTSPSM